MLDLVTTWFMAHPLTGVAGLAVLSVLVGLLLALGTALFSYLAYTVAHRLV